MNKLLAALNPETNFIANCLNLENLPAVPPYWKRMRKLNQEGPPPLGVLGEPPALRVNDFERFANQGAIILDCRSAEAFTAHIPGAINVGLPLGQGPRFLTERPLFWCSRRVGIFGRRVGSFYVSVTISQADGLQEE